MRTFPTKEQLIYGHNSEETALVVNDYPYGFRLRCKIRYWVESTKHGDRFCAQTTNPKITSREVWNKPKKTTYYKMMFMYINDENHVKYNVLDTSNSNRAEVAEIINFIVNVYGMENLSKPAEVTLRMSYYFTTQIGYAFRKAKYLPQTLESFTQWNKDTLKHIAHCEFADIANHPDAPEQDNKDGSAFISSTPISLMDMVGG